MRWVSTLLSNNNDMMSQATQTHWSHIRPLPLSQLGEEGRFIFWRKISIADIQTKVVKLVALYDSNASAWPGSSYHSYYTKSTNPIYMDPDYNSPLIYWWGYCNLSILIGRANLMPQFIWIKTLQRRLAITIHVFALDWAGFEFSVIEG